MKFEFIDTGIAGLWVIKPQILGDGRGSFSEKYKYSEFKKAGIDEVFVQENVSVSAKGVLRGLHFQRPPDAQAKLLRCGRGRIYDVAVDLRAKSATYGKSYSVELTPENGLMFFVPADGFAHGFCSLEDNTELIYKCSREYAPESDGGIRWDDPQLKVKWPVPEPVLSAKDLKLPFLKDINIA